VRLLSVRLRETALGRKAFHQGRTDDCCGQGGFDTIPLQTFQNVMDDWQYRLRRWIQLGGEHLLQPKKKLKKYLIFGNFALTARTSGPPYKLRCENPRRIGKNRPGVVVTVIDNIVHRLQCDDFSHSACPHPGNTTDSRNTDDRFSLASRKPPDLSSPHPPAGRSGDRGLR
jgi:hypothetical protein